MSGHLSTSVRELKGVGPKLAQLLAKKGVHNYEDALYFLPRAYEDRRRITLVQDLLPGMPATVFGKIVSSMDADVVMPPLGVLIGGIDFSHVQIVLRDAVGPDTPAVTLK